MICWLKNIVSYITILTIILMMLFGCLTMSLLPAKYRYKNRFYFFFTSNASKLIIFFSFIKHKIYGKANLKINKNTPVIFVSNHSSFIDIPLLETLLGSRPRVWLSRRIFGLNTLLKRMHVLVNRNAHSDAKHSLARAIELAKTYNSDLVLFPEGHRNDDGNVHKFFPGFAVMAETLDRPVIPIAISGLNKVLPPKSFCIDSAAQTVKISIGKPIDYKNFGTRQEFIDYTHKWFETELLKLNNL